MCISRGVREKQRRNDEIYILKIEESVVGVLYCIWVKSLSAPTVN